MTVQVSKDPAISANFGLILPDYQQYSPIIYDNFLSLQSFVLLYPTDSPEPDSATYKLTSFLPLYLNTQSSSQLFLSQQVLNMYFEAFQQVKRHAFNATTFLGIKCTTDNLNQISEGFAKAFGTGKICLFGIESVKDINITIAAGDFYIEQNLYYLKVYVKDAPEDLEYYEAVRFEADVSQMIFGFRVDKGLLYYYELKNYIFNAMTLDYSKVASYHPNLD